MFEGSPFSESAILLKETADGVSIVTNDVRGVPLHCLLHWSANVAVNTS